MRLLGIVAAMLLLLTAAAGCLDTRNGTDLQKQSTAPKKLQAVPHADLSPECAYKFDAAFSQTCATGSFGELPFVRVHLASKLDGADIEVGYWLPDGGQGERYPIVLMASPYYGNLGAEMGKKSGYLLMLTTNFVQHGYAVAGVSVRGTGDSGGCMDLMGAKERADLDQAVTWLGEQPWSAGSIGMIGLSYDGSTPWTAAATGNPYLKTIVPISGVPDVYGLMFRNGSAEQRGPFLLNLLYYAFFARTDPVVSQAAAVHTLQGIVCPESWEGLGASVYSGATGARDPLGWWAERNRKPLTFQNYKGSILLVQGLADANVDPSMNIPFADDLNQTGLFVHQLLGQWGHNFPDGSRTVAQDRSPQRWDWAEILLHWFDYWLKDQRTVELGPAVQLQDSMYRWHYLDSFPPRDATWVTLKLSNGGKLADAPGTHEAILLTPLSYQGTSLPEQFRSLPTGYAADFSTAPLQENLRISGLVRLPVTVTPLGPAGEVGAYLYDVDETGAEKMIGWSSINLLFADGTETLKPVTPGQELVARLQFEPLDAYVKAGHQLRLRVWERPDADRLGGVPQPVQLHIGGTYLSELRLPTLTTAPETYFNPPFPPK